MPISWPTRGLRTNSRKANFSRSQAFPLRRNAPVSSYTAADQRDRWKAIVAAIAVNAILGVMIVTGLNVRFVGEAVERLVTIHVRDAPPPPARAAPPRPPQ